MVWKLRDLSPNYHAGAWKLHSVIVHKPVSLTEARKHAKNIIGTAKGYKLREDPASWRFSYNKYAFISSSFRSKVINKDITLVYGKLKSKV